MKIKLGRQIVKAEVADSVWKRIKGLSFSSKKRNMIFPMEFNGFWTFWMVGMKFPVWMIFIDKNKRVVDVKYGKPGFNLYVPRRPCRYVLETIKNPRVKIGTKIKW